MQEEAKPEAVLRMIWFGMAMSVVLYGIVAFVVVPVRSPRPLGELYREPFVLILHVVAFATFVSAFVIPTVILRLRRSAGMRREPTTELRISAGARQVVIIRFALLELVALYGLVAAFVMGNRMLFVPPGVLSLAGFLVSWPSDDMLKRLEDPSR